MSWCAHTDISYAYYFSKTTWPLWNKAERVSIARLSTYGLISVHCRVMPNMLINLWVEQYGQPIGHAAHYEYLTKIIWFYIEMLLIHWGWVTHIFVGKLTIIGSDNGLSPGRHQAIIWNNVGMLLIRPLVTNFSEISIEILAFSFKKMRLKVSSVKWRSSCIGLNVLKVVLWVLLVNVQH